LDSKENLTNISEVIVERTEFYSFPVHSLRLISTKNGKHTSQAKPLKILKRHIQTFGDTEIVKIQ